MLERLRTYGIILKEGSLNRAARRLHVSQPSLTRQMQALEAEVGAPLLERQTSGVKPTALGQKLLEVTQPLLDQFDAVLADIRRGARGQQAELRVGYIGSAAERYLNPALSDMRQDFPEMKAQLLDLSPGEQITALKAGKLDLALIGQEGAALSGDFYTRKLAVLGVNVVLPADHRLAEKEVLFAQDLRNETFISTPESEVPGRNQWITQLCRKGKFRPKFVGEAASIGELFTLIASEGAVTFVPNYFAQTARPGVKMVRLGDAGAKWDLLVLWQRGRASKVLRGLIDRLSRNAKATRWTS